MFEWPDDGAPERRDARRRRTIGKRGHRGIARKVYASCQTWNDISRVEADIPDEDATDWAQTEDESGMDMFEMCSGGSE